MINKDLFLRNINAMLDNEHCGSVSDGNHTFFEMYRHRAVLTAALFNSYPDMAWKSKLHADGSMFDGYFIVGMDTPEGQATYHYELSRWDMFRVRELERAPVWDGHTGLEAFLRIRRTFCDEGLQGYVNSKKLIDSIQEAIRATGQSDEYFRGMCNGLLYAQFLVDGKEPQYFRDPLDTSGDDK